jgi:hypothetical protein
MNKETRYARNEFDQRVCVLNPEGKWQQTYCGLILSPHSLRHLDVTRLHPSELCTTCRTRMPQELP